MLEGSYSAKEQLDLKAKKAKNLKQGNEVALLILSSMFCVQKSTIGENSAIHLQVKKWTTETRYSWVMINERQRQRRVDYDSLKKMRRIRRQCSFLAYIVIASNPFNFSSFKELRCGTFGLKHLSYIQYIILYHKSCVLIWHSIFCYL